MEIVFTLEALQETAVKILEAAATKTLAFYGPMGAGKTTLIKAIVRELGGQDEGSSPTFGIVNEYHHKDGNLLGYHFDFYRLNDETEALDLGFEEYLAQDSWVFIEWPERIETLLPETITRIELTVVDSKSRRIKI
jgi:tRNA threonylcarbamoyladenosine biosynthesis protein TsaE